MYGNTPEAEDFRKRKAFLARVQLLSRELQRHYMGVDAELVVDDLVEALLKVKNSVTIEQAREVADAALKGDAHAS